MRPQAEAMTTKPIASPSFKTWFQSYPSWPRYQETMPTLVLNINIHSTPATAGATAYGHIKSVLYIPELLINRSAHTASNKAGIIEQNVTKTENTAVVKNDAR